MQTELTKFDALKGNISIMLEPLKGIRVRDKTENAMAKGALVTVKGLAKEIEALRVAAVGPLNDQIKAINARAKELSGPLEESEREIKFMMGNFAAEETFRLNEERRRQEEKAAAERKRFEEKRRAEEQAAREKEGQARQRLEAEKKAAQESAAQAKAAEEAFGLKVDQEKAAARQAEQDALMERKVKAAEEEAAQRRREREAAATRELADREKREATEAKRLDAQRVANTRTVWKCEVTDWQEVPQEYWVIDEAKIGVAVRSGVRVIPGVRIWSEQTVVVGRV